MRYKTREELKKASAEDIAKTMGINAELAGQVYDFIQNDISN